MRAGMSLISVFLCASVAVAYLSAASAASGAHTFESWADAHRKSYGTLAEEQRARAAYAANTELVDSLNSAYASRGTVFALNKFADMTQQQFREAVLMAPSTAQEATAGAATVAHPVDSPPPAALNWTERGAVTPVKDQGTVGSCWAFSTTGNIEGQVQLKSGKLTPLSEEYLVDCDSRDCGVFGGYPISAFQTVIDKGGLPTEESYPYCSGTGDCYPCMADTNKTQCGPGPSFCNNTQNAKCKHATLVSPISSFMKIAEDEQQIMSALATRGPLSVLIDASYLQFYKSGIWDPAPGLFGCDDSGQSLDHAVLNVGYGTNSNSTDYWIVKNSWGADWGMDGYVMWVRGEEAKHGKGGACGINTAVTTSVV